jgi:hypothetical protein
MTPSETLAMAQQLLERADARTAGLWPRAAALLARQGLEASLDAFWTEKGLKLSDCPTSAQLLCLREFVDKDLAGRLSHTWAALSRACHQHPYELAPSVSELARWIESARELEARPQRTGSWSRPP